MTVATCSVCGRGPHPFTSRSPVSETAARRLRGRPDGRVGPRACRGAAAADRSSHALPSTLHSCAAAVRLGVPCPWPSDRSPQHRPQVRPTCDRTCPPLSRQNGPCSACACPSPEPRGPASRSFPGRRVAGVPQHVAFPRLDGPSLITERRPTVGTCAGRRLPASAPRLPPLWRAGAPGARS